MERAFSHAQHKFGLGLIRARLKETTRSAIALAIAALNLTRIWRVFFLWLLHFIFSPDLLPAIHKITNIPIDVHILIDNPEKLFPAILPQCRKNDYVCVQLETTKDAARLLTMIRNADCIPALAVSVGTPENVLDALVPYADMVNIIVRCNGCPTEKLNGRILDKIHNIRRLFDENGRPEVEIEVDGSIDYNDAVLTVEEGASILVLGTKGVFRSGHTYLENCDELRDRLKKLPQTGSVFCTSR